VTPVDLSVIHFLNPYARVSRAFDDFMVAIAFNNLFKAGPLLVALWALWFSKNPVGRQERRTRIISVTLASCFAAAVSVVLTHLLPWRPRPLIEPRLDFITPFGMAPEGWDRVSSLPSDHAALFFGLAGGLFLISRVWGLLALLHALLFIAFPRAYLGLHYASDLAAGAAIGLALVWIFNTRWVSTQVSQRLLALESVRPDVFYPSMMLLSYGIADLFHDGRGLWGLVKTLAMDNW